MAICERCKGDSLGFWRKQKPLGTDIGLHWLCDVCLTGLPSVSEAKRRGLAFYRRVVYQIVFPVMAVIFTLVELGLHL